MRALLALLLFTLVSCGAARSQSAVSHSMQAIVDRMAKAHPEIARLSIHAVPAGESAMRIVASTVAGRIGEASDPEDLEATKTGRPVQIKEGHNLDYTAPVQDSSGKTIAVVGVTISGASGAAEDALLAKAKEIAAEAAEAIRRSP